LDQELLKCQPGHQAQGNVHVVIKEWSLLSYKCVCLDGVDVNKVVAYLMTQCAAKQWLLMGFSLRAVPHIKTRPLNLHGQCSQTTVHTCLESPLLFFVIDISDIF